MFFHKQKVSQQVNCKIYISISISIATISIVLYSTREYYKMSLVFFHFFHHLAGK